MATAPATELELITLCSALGAAEWGGPLSNDEAELLSVVGSSPDPAAVDLATSAILRGEDILGDAFCNIRSPEARRDSGAFYTPDALVHMMLEQMAVARPARLIDAGCGSGRYAIAAAQRFPEALVVAVDLDPVATLMTRAAARTLNIDLEVRNESFLTYAPEPVHGSTAWVGNPPYLRHHNLPPEVKLWGKTTATELGVSLSGLAGLHALFFLAVAAHASPGDVGCFVTSSEWLEAKYGQVVRDLLTGALPAISVDIVAPEAKVFTDATTTAVVTTFRVGGVASTSMFRLVQSADELCAVEEPLAVPVERMRESKRWSSLVNAGATTYKGPKLGDVVSVQRGIATGANSFFCMTAERASSLGLDQYANPVVSRAAEVFGSKGVLRAKDVKKVLLLLPRDLTGHPAAAAYVAAGEKLGVNLGYVCSHRNPWWHIPPPPAPIGFATCMARQPIMFAANPDGLLSLNTVHGLRAAEKMTVRSFQALVRALNSNRHDLVGGRIYQGGLMKYEPKEVEALPLPQL